MTTAGWINLILSVGCVATLFAWCLYRVLSYNPPSKSIIEESLKDPPGTED
ncbi:MAG: hypothetical protein AB1813_11770 [Verrucomicrobiota bacterium]|jgi:hypothetical protein